MNFLSKARNNFFEQFYTREVLIWLIKCRWDLDKLCNICVKLISDVYHTSSRGFVVKRLTWMDPDQLFPNLTIGGLHIPTESIHFIISSSWKHPSNELGVSLKSFKNLTMVCTSQ